MSEVRFRHHTLRNGLQIVAECNPNAYSTGLAYFVKTGSRDETEEISGVSHFLEHMVFKGTPTRTAEQVNQQLDEIGSQSNAFTSEEQTVYYCAVLPEFQLPALELLSDILRPLLRQDDFDTEKQVILEEIAKYDDQPPFGAHEKALAYHFQQHPLGRSVLGTRETVGQLRRDQMLNYFNLRYSAGNIVLAMAGNVDFDAVITQLEKQIGHWENYDTQRDTPRAQPNSGFHSLEKPSAHQQYIIQISNGPAAEDDNRYASRLLALIFGDENNSRLFWEMIDTGKAEYAVVEPSEYQGTGIFLSYLCCQPDSVQEILELYQTLARDIQEHGVTQQELELAKSKVCSHIVLRAERAASRMFGIGNNWVQRGEYTSIQESIKRFQSVTPADLAEVLEKYPLTQCTSVAIGPTKIEHM
ncbi:MAG: peptidase M16 [Planctomycetaceae bacterium]|nr:peptidase M16 [Planctomycetaceae bacterium]